MIDVFTNFIVIYNHNLIPNMKIQGEAKQLIIDSVRESKVL